jgi:hypothetical protein
MALGVLTWSGSLCGALKIRATTAIRRCFVRALHFGPQVDWPKQDKRLFIRKDFVPARETRAVISPDRTGCGCTEGALIPSRRGGGGMRPRWPAVLRPAALSARRWKRVSVRVRPAGVQGAEPAARAFGGAQSDARLDPARAAPGLRLNDHLKHEEGEVMFRHACKLGLQEPQRFCHLWRKRLGGLGWKSMLYLCPELQGFGSSE